MTNWLTAKIRSSLGARLALLTAGLLSLATVMIGAIFFAAGRSALRAQIESSLTGLAASRAGQIAGVVEQDFERTALVASRTRLRELLVAIVSDGGEDSVARREQMVRILSDAIASVDAIQRIQILDTSGRSVVWAGVPSGGDVRPSDEAILAALAGSVQGAWRHFDGALHYDVYAPLLHPDSSRPDVIGVIKTTSRADRVIRILTDFSGMGATGELVLGKREGEQIVILSPRRHAAQAGIPPYALSDDPGEGIALRRALAGQTGFMRNSRDYRGIRTLAAYRPVGVGGYCLVAKMDVAEAFGPIYRLAIWGAIGGVLVIIAGLVCAIAFARLLVRPIKALSLATETIARGDFTHRVPDCGTDAIGQLARSFNDMVRRIEEITASRDELNREIGERKEVEARLAETAETLQDQHARMVADLNVAREIQSVLLPRKQIAFRSSTLAGQNTLNFEHYYRPSLALGGDFFQVIPLSDHSAAAVICDVMGHGVRSALVTAIFRGLLAENRQETDDPAQLLCRLNRGLMTVLSQPEQFTLVSAACLVFDLRIGRVACANAGHPPPLSINRREGTVQIIGPPVARVGPALGTDPNPYFEVGYHSIDPEDRFLLYTDGLFEVSALGDDAFLGQERLTRIIGSHAGDTLGAFIAGIVKDVETVRCGAEFDDDICLLGIELGAL